MKTYLFCLLFIHSCFMITTVHAQHQIQGGVYFGGINYEGDLVPNSVILSLTETHLDLGAFLYLKANDWLALKINYHHGNLSGTDAHSNDEGRLNRNLSFWSPLDELSVSGAFFYNVYSKKQHLIQPFLTLGLGLFRFNPQAKFEGKWYELQPLSTEGQGLKSFPNRQPYKRVQVCFPVGAGLQWHLGKRTELAVEVSFRKTLTDYLDDVSTTYVPLDDLREERGDIAALLSNRILSKDAVSHSVTMRNRGNSQNKDWYLIGSIGIVFNVLGKNGRENFFKKKNNLLNCKQFFKKRI